MQPAQASVWRFLTKLKIDLSREPATPLWSTYPKVPKLARHRSTYLFVAIAAAFTKVREWDQPRHPSTDEQIKRTGHMCTEQLSMTLGTMW